MLDVYKQGKYTRTLIQLNPWKLWNKIEYYLKETKSAKIFKQRVINIYLENYERFKCEKPSCISCE